LSLSYPFGGIGLRRQVKETLIGFGILHHGGGFAVHH
jgi:hypothetical protein